MSNRGAPRDSEIAPKRVVPRVNNPSQALPSAAEEEQTATASKNHLKPRESRAQRSVAPGPDSTADLSKSLVPEKSPDRRVESWRVLLWRSILLRRKGGSSRQATRRTEVLEAIASAGDSSLGPIVRPSLQDHWVVVREAAARTLGEIDDLDAVPELLKIVDEDENPAVRQAAAQSLCQLQDPSAISSLLRFVQSFPKHSQSIPAGLMQMGKGKDGVTHLLKVLEDPHTPGLSVAIDVVGRLADPRAMRSLVALTNHTSEPIRNAAIHALGQIRDPRIEGFLRGLLRRSPPSTTLTTVIQALVAQGSDRDLEEFIPLLEHPSDECRMAACQLLARATDSGSMATPLAQRLKDSDAGVRREAAVALRRVGGRQGISGLIESLQDSSEQVRAAACQSLGSLGDFRSLDPLCRALGDDHESVRIAAAAALGMLGDNRAVPVLCFAVRKERTLEPRIAAIRALGQLGDSRTLPVLRELLRQPTAIKTQVVVAIGQIGSSAAVDLLIPLLADAQAIVRYHAALGLGHIGDPRAIPPLARLIEDPESLVLRGVAKALGQFQISQARILKGQAEAALRLSLDRPTESKETKSVGSPRSSSQSFRSLHLVAGGLFAVVLLLGLGYVWLRSARTFPQGVSSETPLAFSRGDVAGLGGSSAAGELRVVTSGGWVEQWSLTKNTLLSRSDRRLDVGSTVRFSGDGLVFATVLGRKLKTIDSTTGEELTMVPVSDRVRWFALDRTGQQAIVWESDRGLTSWNLRTSTPQWQIERDPQSHWSTIAITDDFERLAIGTANGEIVVLNPGSQQRAARAPSPVPQLSLIEFSPDGKLLAVSDVHGNLAILDPGGNRVLDRVASHVTGMGALRWSSEGEWVVGVGSESLVAWQHREGVLRRVSVDASTSNGGHVPELLWIDSRGDFVAAASPQGRTVMSWTWPDLQPRPSLLPP